MQLVRSTYDERVSDIESHFELIKNISDAIGNGGANLLVNDNQYSITTQQQKILFASTYLQLYNLVEATISQLLGAVGRHSQEGINGDLTRLSDKIRDLYLKNIIPPEDNLTPEKRLERSLKLLHQAVGIESVEIKIPRGGGGNWDMLTINNLNNRVGVDLTLPPDVRQRLNRAFRNEKGPLRHIKEVRNNLGHGSISFTDCGAGHTYSEFRELIDNVKDYLSHLMDAYEEYLSQRRYLSSVD